MIAYPRDVEEEMGAFCCSYLGRYFQIRPFFSARRRCVDAQSIGHGQLQWHRASHRPAAPGRRASSYRDSRTPERLDLGSITPPTLLIYPNQERPQTFSNMSSLGIRHRWIREQRRLGHVWTSRKLFSSADSNFSTRELIVPCALGPRGGRAPEAYPNG